MVLEFELSVHLTLTNPLDPPVCFITAPIKKTCNPEKLFDRTSGPKLIRCRSSLQCSLSRLLLKLQGLFRCCFEAMASSWPLADRLASYNPLPTVVQDSVASRSPPSTTEDKPGPPVQEVFPATHPSTLSIPPDHDKSRGPSQPLSLAQHLILLFHSVYLHQQGSQRLHLPVALAVLPFTSCSFA